MRNTEAVIGGLGVYLPRKIVTSRELDAQLGLRPGWLEQNCGVRQRHVVSGDETQELMGTEAARAALAEAELDARDLDLLLFGAAVGRQPIPATAPLIKQMFGASDRSYPAFDVNATCLSALVWRAGAEINALVARGFVENSFRAGRVLQLLQRPLAATTHQPRASSQMP